MRYEILEDLEVINTIEADEEFMLENFTPEQYQLAAPLPVAPVVAHTKLTKRAFQSRFPKIPNGVTTKYTAMDFFMTNDAYAAQLSVPVVGADLIALRLLILEGVGLLAKSTHVDLALSNAALFTGMLTQPSIPIEFRLTSAERSAILALPVLDGEKFQ